MRKLANPRSCEKSATARVASRISLSSRSRFSRIGLSSTFTVTLSKNASTGPQLRHRGHGGGEVFLGDGGGGFRLGGVDRLRQRPFLVLAVERGVGLADIFAGVLLLLDAQDVGGALGAGEQVLAVLGVEEFAERLDAADDEQRSSWPSSANTASTRSWRAPCSRSCTFRRSAKKASRIVELISGRSLPIDQLERNAIEPLCHRSK